MRELSLQVVSQSSCIISKKLQVSEFGFKMQTSCGEIAYPNQWNKCWIEFFFTNRLEFVISKIGNRELTTLFENLCSKKDRLFDDAKE